MVSRGFETTLEKAYESAVKASQDEREVLQKKCFELLVGWDPGTPIYSSTLENWKSELPLKIYRGPCTSKELFSSWDLPVAARYQNGILDIVPEEEYLKWDDEESREEQRERQRQGELISKTKERLALEMILKKCPQLEAWHDGRSVKRVTLHSSHMGDIEVFGPVRLSDTGPLLKMKWTKGNPRGYSCWGSTNILDGAI